MTPVYIDLLSATVRRCEQSAHGPGPKLALPTYVNMDISTAMLNFKPDASMGGLSAATDDLSQDRTD